MEHERQRCPGSCSWIGLILLVVVGGVACEPMSASSEELQLSVDVSPAVISKGAGSDSVEISVRVTNPRWRPVFVDLGGPPYRLRSRPEESSGQGFGYRIERPDGSPGGPGSRTFGHPIYSFDARETLRHTWTVRVNATGGYGLAPGDYRVIGSFGKSGGAVARLTVRP